MLLHHSGSSPFLILTVPFSEVPQFDILSLVLHINSSCEASSFGKLRIDPQR